MTAPRVPKPKPPLEREVQRGIVQYLKAAGALRQAKVDLREQAADRFKALCVAHGLPAPVPEYRFHPTRKWRWDWSWPDVKLALEVDGGIWVRGKHGRGSGIVKDHEKRNAGAVLGWRLLVVTPTQLYTLDTVRLIKRALAASGGCFTPEVARA